MQPSISEFLKPRSVRVQAETGNRARIVIEPLEPGFGYTLGNSLCGSGRLRNSPRRCVAAYLRTRGRNAFGSR